MNYYILDGQIPIQIDSALESMMWRIQNMEKCIVGKEVIDNGLEVSTVFLSTAMNDSEPPFVFETCIFSGDDSHVVDRYYTWELALVGHNQIVDKISAGADPRSL